MANISFLANTDTPQLILSVLSLAAIATLAAITYYLASHRRVHIFISVGQDVFRWLFGVLVVIFVTRICATLSLLSTNFSRNLNSIIFIASIVGILWSVTRHGKSY